MAKEEEGPSLTLDNSAFRGFVTALPLERMAGVGDRALGSGKLGLSTEPLVSSMAQLRGIFLEQLPTLEKMENKLSRVVPRETFLQGHRK